MDKGKPLTATDKPSEQLVSDVLNARLSYVRREAVQALGELESSSPQVVAALLVARESDEDPDVRDNAARALQAANHQAVLSQQGEALNALVQAYKTQQHNTLLLEQQTLRREKLLRRWHGLFSLVMLLLTYPLLLFDPAFLPPGWRWGLLAACWTIMLFGEIFFKTKSVRYKGWRSLLVVFLQHALVTILLLFFILGQVNLGFALLLMTGVWFISVWEENRL